jgi:hypothetical protein
MAESRFQLNPSVHFAVDLLSTAYNSVNSAQSTQKYFCIETWAFGSEGACHDIWEKGSEIMSLLFFLFF